MTKQQLFDRVKTHLLTQKTRAAERGVCQYRTRDGLQCAIGCLIPDDSYSQKFEEHVIGGKKRKKETPTGLKSLREAAGITDELLALAAALQWVHDIDDPRDWPKALEKVRSDFHLEETI
jgi:hypothetical protein